MSCLGHIENLKDNSKYNFYSFFFDDWNSNKLIIEPYKYIFNNNKPLKKIHTTDFNNVYIFI